ncbi:hypothetical protein D3C81_751990 [compost metagenome]
MARQAQHRSGLSQLGLGIAYTDQRVQGNGDHHGFHQHHQLEQLADPEEQHEQRDPGQGRYLCQRHEGRQHQRLRPPRSTQPDPQQQPAADADRQPPEQPLQAYPQVPPQLAGAKLHRALPNQCWRWQDLLAHPVLPAGHYPQHGNCCRRQVCEAFVGAALCRDRAAQRPPEPPPIPAQNSIHRPSLEALLDYSFMELKILKNDFQEIRACASCIRKPLAVAFSSYFPCVFRKPTAGPHAA